MAKIVRFHQIGGPEVLKIEEVPSREPGKGEAKLRVQAVGLNRAESMFMHGNYVEPTKLPATLGYEASGIFQYGWLSDEPTPFPLIPALQKGLTIRGYWLWETVKDAETFARAKSYIYERVKRRDFQPKIAKTFRFEDVVDAYRYMESNEQIGKIVLIVG